MKVILNLPDNTISFQTPDRIASAIEDVIQRVFPDATVDQVLMENSVTRETLQEISSITVIAAPNNPFPHLLDLKVYPTPKEQPGMFMLLPKPSLHLFLVVLNGKPSEIQVYQVGDSPKDRFRIDRTNPKKHVIA